MAFHNRAVLADLIDADGAIVAADRFPLLPRIKRLWDVLTKSVD